MELSRRRNAYGRRTAGRRMRSASSMAKGSLCDRCLPVGTLMLVEAPIPEGLLMTTPHARQPQVLPRPACTPAAIRAVLAANADGDVLQRYDEELDAAFAQAREQ